MPAPKRDITPRELTTNAARQHPGDGGPGLAEASASREMSRIPDSGSGAGLEIRYSFSPSRFRAVIVAAQKY